MGSNQEKTKQMSTKKKKEKDERLMDLLDEVRVRLKEVNELLDYGRETGNRYEEAIWDLNHILEINKNTLSEDSKLKLQRHQEKFLAKRRVVKNIVAVDGMIGSGVRNFLKELEGNSKKVRVLLSDENKYYRLRSPDVEAIFEDITGQTVESTNGRYTGVGEKKFDYRKKKRLGKLENEIKIREENLKQESKKQGKSLEGKTFEKELSKVVGRRGNRRKKRKK